MLLQEQGPLLEGETLILLRSCPPLSSPGFSRVNKSRRSGLLGKTISKTGLLKWRLQYKSKSWIVPEQLHGPRHEVFVKFLWGTSSSFIISWCYTEDAYPATFGTCESAVELPTINMFTVCWERIQWSQIQKNISKPEESDLQ